MKRFGWGILAAVATIATAGCANGPPGHMQRYDQLPGSGDHMASGPGLIHTRKTDQNYQGGMRIFSDNPGQGALVNPNAHQANAKQQSSGQATYSQQSASATARSAAPRQAPQSASNSPSPGRQRTFRQFQQYQQFQKFQHMPRNSPEYRKFREWQEWKQYQQWKNNGQNSNP